MLLLILMGISVVFINLVIWGGSIYLIYFLIKKLIKYYKDKK